MPAVARVGDTSTGHGCFPPTNMTGSPVSKTFINGILPGVVGSSFVPHSCGDSTHLVRTVTSGASKTFIEGNPVARIGDPISCGDTCGQGSPNTFVE